ncbi:MAG: serine/threonine-protein kinase [Cyanobacteria bacterium J06560_2]
MPSPQKAPVTPKRSNKKERSTDATATLTTKDKFATWQQQLIAKHWRFAISAMCTAIAASAVSLDLGIVNLWERQVQSLFFELRGPVPAPENVVILAIDEESLSQGQHYRDNPERYQVLEPIASWPWKREAYAQVIERLMAAGAKSVSLDILFTEDSAHGPADDVAFAEVLSRYNENVVLAAEYGSDISPQLGELFQPFLPLDKFQQTGVWTGSINFHIEPNQKIHRLGQTFLRDAVPSVGNPGEASAVIDEAFDSSPLSFAQATLEAAGETYAPEPQENIFFHGPRNTFRQIPFWYVLDDDPWHNKLKSGQVFKDKIVIVGSTAAARQDFHQAPFSQSLLYPYQMAGVEILANAIATLEQDISPTQLIKRPALNALVVLALGLSIAALLNRSQRHSRRAMVAGGGLSLWILISYLAFVVGNIVLITGTPIVAIATFGLLDFGISFTGDKFRRKRLRTALARFATSPVVQEIISQQDDFQDLLDVNRTDIVGKVLRDRYRILEVIGAGGFGETYRAQDTLRPGQPICVVKQLKIVSDNPKSHYLARRLFDEEAVALGKLGEHDQIPRLLAYFEAQHTFYLVQEMVVGKLLRDILAGSRPLSQRAVVKLLRDLLPVVSFVHSQRVIHRDIKPSNIILRKRDERYVLIDFGAVKTISNKLPESATRLTSTVGIGTQGYMPSEQSIGQPSFRSDIYALGVTAIEALTGRPPHAFKRSDDGEIIWSHTIEEMSPDLSRIINKMVRYDFNKRYGSSDEVLAELAQIQDDQLTDEAAIASEEFQLMAGTTVNQGTRPGVIDTNSGLDNTQILPADWLNDMNTQADEAGPEDT